MLALALCMIFTACNNNSSVKMDNSSKPSADISQGYDTETTLRVLRGGVQNQSLTDRRTVAFKKLYPNATIEYIDKPIDISKEAFADKMAVEIMSGKGPDVYMVGDSTGYLGDVYKMINAGAFFDITDFLEKDKLFKEDDYLKAALDACKIAGKQYIMPIGISTPFILSSERILNDINFDMNNSKDITAIMGQLNSYYKTRETTDQRTAMGPYYNFLPSYMNYIDYKNSSVVIDTPDMITFVEAFKYIEEHASDGSYSNEANAQRLMNDETIMLLWNLSMEMLNTISLLQENEKAVLIPINNLNGKFQAEITEYSAVSATCKNKKIAYNFMMMVSRNSNVEKLPASEIQTSGTLVTYEYLPVYKPWYNFQLELYKNPPTALEGKKIKPFPSDILNQFATLLDNIEICTIYTDGNKMLMQYLLPYFNDKATLESCLETAQSAMEIYISE